MDPPAFATPSDPTTREPALGSHAPRGSAVWLLMLIVVASAALRFGAARGDLHLDEIWSFRIAEKADDLGDVFGFRHDNNHILNTTVLWLLGSEASIFVMRLFPTLASLASVALAAAIAGCWASAGTRWPALLITPLLFGSSFFLIQFGTEARGYGYAVSFSLAALLLLERSDRGWTAAEGLLFSLSQVLALLSHLTSVFALAATLTWLGWTLVFRPTRSRATWPLLVAHLPPILTGGLLYVFFIRGMAIGGGPRSSALDAITSAASLTLAGPAAGALAHLVAIVAAALFVAGLIRIGRADRRRAAMVFVLVILAPGASLVATRYPVHYSRYFLIPAAGALLVVGHELAAIWVRRGVWRGLAIAGLGGVLLANALWLADLLRHGRGHYAALQFIVSQSTTPQPDVTSVHDFRNPMLMGFYAQRLWPGENRFLYASEQRLPPGATEWLIIHTLNDDPYFPPEIELDIGVRYRLASVFPYGGLSGFNWGIYRRISVEPSSR